VSAASLDATADDIVAALTALSERLQARCLERGLTVGTAESCTGGLVAHVLTEVAGSSGYFVGGIVSYSDAAKEHLLDVPQDVLAAHGAVSAQVARAMADGARKRLGTSLAVAITGIAGPDGGTPDKPVGLVFIALEGAIGTRVRRLHFPGSRDRVRHQACQAALEMMRRGLLGLSAL
jgi:nicotinamide-nucleotide amidase